MEKQDDLKRRKAGRPPLSDGRTVPITVRMTAEQREKLARLGGAPWVRMKIDRAREPNE